MAAVLFRIDLIEDINRKAALYCVPRLLANMRQVEAFIPLVLLMVNSCPCAIFLVFIQSST